MHHSTIHLLRMIGRQVATAVAIVVMLLLVLRTPCLPFTDQANDKAVAAQMGKVSSHVGGGSLCSHDMDKCGHCHCSTVGFCVIPNAMAWIPMCMDVRDAQRPTSSQVPEDLTRVPDVPPDQV